MDTPSQLLQASRLPISAAKISPPALARHAIDRDRLLPPGPVAEHMLLGVITAPAGFGKTTAAAHIAAKLDTGFSWYTVEASDNDIFVFLAHLCASLDIDDETCHQMKASLEDPERGAPVAYDILRVAIEQMDRRVVLVLDDFHKITNAVILATLTKWLVVPPANFTMLCVGRTQPALPLQRTRTHGRLFELRSAELAFTNDEAVEMFSAAFDTNGPDSCTIASIMEATQGWPSATYIAGLSATTIAKSPTDRHPIVQDQDVATYLRAVLPVSMSEAELNFLRDTSVLDTLSPELCDALTQTSTSAQTLQSLVQHDQLVSRTDSSENSYVCHRLVQSYFRHQLATTDPDKLKSLNQRAALWYEDHDQLADAIRCAIATENVKLGQGLVLQCWQASTDFESFGAAREWAEAMGPDGTDRGSVCMVLAWDALASYDEPNMRRWIARAHALGGDRDVDTGVVVSTQLIDALWSCFIGDIAAMEEHVHAAEQTRQRLAQSTEPGPGLALLHDSTFSTLTMAAFLSGDFESAHSLATTTVALARKHGSRHTLVYALSYLAIVDALQGRANLALAHADEALARTTKARRNLPTPDVAHLARSIALLALNEIDRAEIEADAALATAHPVYQPVQRGLIHIQLARLNHRRGHVTEARNALNLARDLARSTDPSLLARQVQIAQNELRFLGVDSDERLPPEARELTEREIEILQLLPEALSRGELAEKLHISENTIKTHLTAISRKLAVRGREAIVERARELELLESAQPQ